MPEDDFLVLDVDVVVMLVECDEVGEQHRDDCFFICSHDDVHDEAQNFLVGLFVGVSCEVVREDCDKVLQECIGFYDYGALWVVFQVIADEDEDVEGEDLYAFVGCGGNVEQVFEDVVDVLVIEEDLGEAFSQRCETYQCVLPHDLLLVLNELIQVCEAVGEAL